MSQFVYFLFISKRFIRDTHQRIVSLSSAASEESSSQQSCVVPNECTADEFDDFLSRVIGSSPINLSHVSTFNTQLRQIELESRQSYQYDVWNHWLTRKQTHPEFFAVAMVVLATPSNQVSVERAFSALALVLSDLRTGIAEKTLEEILLVKLNRSVFQNVIPTLYNWGTDALE